MATSGEPATRDPQVLWRWMQFFVLLTILSYIAVIAGGIATWAVLAHYVHLNIEQATIVDMTFAGGAIAALVLYLLSAFATARLTYRLMKNAHALKTDEELTSPGWAVGWYFIPFANLAMPPRAVGQIWRTTFRYLAQERGSAIIGWWWAFWIVSTVWLTVVDRASAGSSSQQPDEAYYVVTAIGYVLRTICAMLLLVVFGTLTKAQRHLDRVADVFA